jgi:AraC-like DNA-binding protein
MEKGTISNVFVRAAVTGLRGDAARLGRALSAAGIGEDLLDPPDARVPAERFAALWLAVAQELDDEFLGLDSRRMKRGSFALVCQSLIHAGNLERAIRQALRGFAVVFDDLRGELTVAGAEAGLRVTNRIADPASRMFADELFLVILRGLVCGLAGRRVPFTRASFAYPRPVHSVEYHAMFTSDLAFDAPETGVWFSARFLQCPVVQDEAGLKRFLRDAPQSVFMRYKNTDGWVARVRRRLRRLDGDQWPTLDAMADELHVTASTLRRRLEDEGSSYRQLKDDLRRDLAIDLLCRTRRSVESIAADLGYQEVSAFYRAFKHWTGTQPGSYREQRRDPPH